MWSSYGKEKERPGDGVRGNVIIVGPNTPGVINPGKRIKVGVMPDHVFSPGIIGMVSRSGALTYEIAWHISKAGLGQSTWGTLEQ